MSIVERTQFNSKISGPCSMMMFGTVYQKQMEAHCSLLILFHFMLKKALIVIPWKAHFWHFEHMYACLHDPDRHERTKTMWQKFVDSTENKSLSQIYENI